MLSPELQTHRPVGLVTKYAILGVVFGVITVPLWCLITHQFPIQTGLFAGFAGGLTGGAAWGLVKKYLNRD